jgi:hypothetical protein
MNLLEFSSNNFLIRHEFKDFYSQIQRNLPRIGDKGKVSTEFVDRAFKQFQNHDFNKLAEIQDEYVAPSAEYGTTGRENNRNYNRMEYDENERHDGKDKETVMKDVDSTVQLTVDKILNAFKEHGYTLNNSAVAVGTEPITKSAYDRQMTTDK